MEKMNIYQKLSCIQNELNVPKNLYNKFGKYYYRNAETILETAKPICQKYKTTLVVEDGIELVNERYYVRAIASLYDWESDLKVSVVSYAREEDTKKGMDASQITGSCSSYARKYALNGLFNIDDVKDADSNENKNEQQNKAQNNQQNYDINAIAIKFNNCRQRLADVGCDFRNPTVVEFIKQKTGYDNVDYDLENPVKMLKIIAVYEAMIEKKTK